MSERWNIEDLPPAPKNMTEQEKKEQIERMRKVMFKIFSRMPVQEVIRTYRNQKANYGH